MKHERFSQSELDRLPQWSTAALERRMSALPAPGLADELVVTRGSMGDYAALCEHHYRASRPGTCTRVLVLRHRSVDVVGRFVGGRAQTLVVGVLIESLPSLNCRLRDQALGDRYIRLKGARARAAALTADLRCISRVVIHPQWRGLGLAVRLVRAALADAQTPLTEALAAMGHVNPFFERAGMTAYHRPAHAVDQRLADALGAAGFGPYDLALPASAARRIEGLADDRRAWLLGELDRWRRKTLRSSVVDEMALVEQLRAAQARLACAPVYYLKDNRE